MHRLLATPVHRFEAYAGKVPARVAFACAQAILLLGCGVLVFRLPLGDHPFYVLPVIVCLAVFSGALSILAGTIRQTEKQVLLVAIFGSMILSALGGCWWSIELVPDTFKTVAMLTPSYWAMHGLHSVLYFGRSYEVLMLDCPLLLGFAVLCGFAALLTARLLAKRSGLAGG